MFQFPAVEDRTLPSILAHHAGARPDAEFLQFGDAPALTFGGVETETNQLARGLRDLGVAQGDRVAMLLPNCPELVLAWFATAKLGAVEVPVNIELRGRLLTHVLASSGAKVLVCHRDLLEAVAAVAADVPALATVVVVGGAAADVGAVGLSHRGLELPALVTGSADPVAVTVRPSDPLAILYTSGTTGPAKGAVMPHHQYYVWVELYARSLQLTRDDTYFTPLPLFHADGQLWGAYFPLVFGTKGTFVERFSASRYWDQVRASGATATNMLGAMGHILWKQERRPDDVDNPLRVAQAIPMLSIKTEFEQRFDMTLVTGYGQTETNWVSYDTPDEWRQGSCGKVTDEFYEVQILDDDDQPLPIGAVGHIAVRPKHAWTISTGYHGNAEATQETWRNLWFHSGDAGRLDEDGWLYFSDRIKDVIRRRGSNISAFELESVINDHELVEECAAVAVSSELSEDDVLVFVVVKDGVELAPEDLLVYCTAQLPKFMVPRYVEIMTERLPRTPTEKISKPELRQRGVGPRTWDAERTAYAVLTA